MVRVRPAADAAPKAAARRTVIVIEEPATEPDPPAEVENHEAAFICFWASVVRRQLRVAFKRKQWAFLGHHLNAIKAAGRAAIAEP